MLDLQQKEIFMKNYINYLKNMPLFKNISSNRIHELLEILNAYVNHYQKNEYVKHTGDPVNFIGIILEGNIQIIQDDFYGNRNIIASFDAGSLFAEAFVCAGIPTLPVDILANSNTEIMFISSQKIFAPCSCCCEYHHIFITNLLKIVATKNIILSQKLHCISHKTTEEKILSYLNSQAKLHDSYEFDIPFNRQGLADYLGVERSAMSTVINQLVKQEVIETNRSHFKILHPIFNSSTEKTNNFDMYDSTF